MTKDSFLITEKAAASYLIQKMTETDVFIKGFQLFFSANKKVSVRK
ncbi:hypothetical protein RV15_GL000255 [Enterococcus silesiacus]|uniref:Uncharacterized protein n=1 Tax=Enterococcus silesiacus TaxID=332949 RepID=A0AA91GAH7_9ENTE|nr:hypothetical protein RV15_GL000255 [Enterococcus silesiacus]